MTMTKEEMREWFEIEHLPQSLKTRKRKLIEQFEKNLPRSIEKYRQDFPNMSPEEVKAVLHIIFVGELPERLEEAEEELRGFFEEILKRHDKN
jgi:hypothetical protein